MTKIERLRFLAAVLIASFLGHWLKFDEGFNRYDHKSILPEAEQR